MAAAIAAVSAGPLSGRRVPSFALPDVKATYYDILDYRGKVVLVEMMQTNCPHCQSLIAPLEKVQAKYGSNVQILSIVVPPDNAATVGKYIERYKIPYPVLFDCGQATAALLKLSPANPKVTFPQLLLVDKAGMIREDYEGARDEAFLTGPGLFQSIDRLLTGGPAAKAPATSVKE
jgi:peroxiredoxin